NWVEAVDKFRWRLVQERTSFAGLCSTTIATRRWTPAAGSTTSTRFPRTTTTAINSVVASADQLSRTRRFSLVSTTASVSSRETLLSETFSRQPHDKASFVFSPASKQQCGIE